MRILEANRKYVAKHGLYTHDYIFLNLDTGEEEQWSAHVMTGLDTLVYRGMELKRVAIIG
jgi:regulatory protein YycH of two-component signal transduction system YycFG